ncbi:MAG: hypothetical protein SFV18_08495 [Bryobacteraceae bacterium]|nr:hypothetical protein [Bryobacteraceae bacterium]
MKIAILLVTFAVSAFAQEPAKKTAAAKEPAKKSAAKSGKATAKKTEPPPPSGLPSDAVKIGDYDWRWVDPKGKAWIYRRGPVGYSRWEETQADIDARKAKPE